MQTGGLLVATGLVLAARPGSIDRGLEDPFLGRLAALHLGGDPALAEDQDAVTHADQLGQFGRDQDDREALAREIGDQAVDLGLGLDVDALGRLVQDQNPGCRRQPLGEHDLLLVAAGEGLDRLVVAAEAEPEPLERRLDQCELAPGVDQPGHDRLVDRRQGRVGEDGEIHHQALPHAVFGEVGDPVAERFARRAGCHGPALEADRAGARPVDAEQDPGDLGPTAADQAAEAHDLARADRKRDVRERPFAREPLHAQDLVPDLGRQGRVEVAERPADHQLDGAVARHLTGRLGRDQAAVAQHADAIGDAVDLVHPVTDEHDRDRALAQPLHDLEQPLDLTQRERCGRLVHDQDARIGRQRARDLDQLLLRAAELLQGHARVASEADRVDQHRGRAADLPTVKAPEAIRRHVTEEQVLGDRQIGEQPRMLMDHGNPAAEGIEGRAQLNGRPVEHDLPGIGPIEAAQKLDAGALAGTVFPKQGEHLAGAQIQGDVLDGDRAAKGLGRILEPEHRPATHFRVTGKGRGPVVEPYRHARFRWDGRHPTRQVRLFPPDAAPAVLRIARAAFYGNANARARARRLARALVMPVDRSNDLSRTGA